ncbi:hypothetical protein JTE90_014822 [Oedothorax gibbosus]|uniref:Uncharacterized protein n=1 Tax=Oedothorax gibbosus TaxID=931172 RepID=A0AAV6UD63_9ARAC|nr:hypothetical protein JTE90_014822 [Oedothorax gibbosus]
MKSKNTGIREMNTAQYVATDLEPKPVNSANSTPFRRYFRTLANGDALILELFRSPNGELVGVLHLLSGTNLQL